MSGFRFCTRPRTTGCIHEHRKPRKVHAVPTQFMPHPRGGQGREGKHVSHQRYHFLSAVLRRAARLVKSRPASHTAAAST